MTREMFKVARVFTEFPWLSKHASADEVVDVKISRLSMETMITYPTRRCSEDAMFLLDNNGDKVAEVGTRCGQLKYFLRSIIGARCRAWIQQEENIVDTLARIGDVKSNKVAFALSIEHLWYNIEPNINLTIYKMPQKFPIMTSWIAELERRADNSAKQQIAEIDDAN